MANQSGTFPLRKYDWYGGSLEVRWSVTDRGDNRSDVYAALWAKTNGFTTYGPSAYFTFRLGGSDGNWTGAVSVSGSWKMIAERGRTIDHGANGSLNGIDIGVLAGEVYGTSFNSIAYDGVNLIYVNATDYVVLPYAPYNLRIAGGSVTATCFGVYYDRSSHDSLDRSDQAQWATDSGFTNVVWTDEGPQGFTQPCTAAPPFSLTPSTKYYVRVRSHTSAGWGPWSAAISQTTLPATPPGLSVSASPSGTSSVATMSPPGGVTGVDSYTLEWRLQGTTPWTAVTTGTTYTVTPLTPGLTYEYRASARIGGYTSPISTTVTLAQPKPNTDPGDYFDGDTASPASGDLDYSWSVPASPHASTSIATAKGVMGWEAEFTTSGGAGVLYRITAGIFGSVYAARVQLSRDATTAGLRAGQQDLAPYWTDVSGGSPYIGSISVRPSRSQRLAAEVTWLTTAGTLISRSVGAATVVAGGTWARLVGGGTAPATAVHAVVRVIDVSGTGWSKWLGGESIELDGAMISLNEQFPYFDGSMLTDGVYVYEWSDPAKPNASTSTRTPIEQANLEVLESQRIGARAILDPACLPPTPPRPPVIENACVTDAALWRRAIAAIPTGMISEYLNVVPTFEIVTTTKAVNQVRIRLYPNPTELPIDLVDLSHGWISEQIISYVPMHTVMTIDGVHQRVYAEVGGLEAISADHLLYGSKGTPATWPVLTCGQAYVIVADIPVELTQDDARLYTQLTTRY